MRIGQNMKFRSFYRLFFFTLCNQRQAPIRNLGTLVLLILSVFAHNALAQLAIEDLESLNVRIAQFLTEEYRHAEASKVNVKVSLDSRLRLAKCDQSLVFNLQDPNHSGGNITVHVACRGSSPWTILTSAQAIVYRPMAVASRNLQRGELINSADVDVAVLDVSQLRQGYKSTPEDIIGKQLKYPVNKGEAFRISVLDMPLAIKRGDQVSIEALTGNIRVATTGTAISDGRIGQQIKIKNNQSARILSAKVLGPGKVGSI
jgi:flagellar basal body P-ring formation protein FlgA